MEMRKPHRVTLPGIAALAGILALALGGTAFAFHRGGVADCGGCHSVHDSPENPVSGTPNSLLLIGADPSSTCLKCHAGSGGEHVLSADASNWSPGGDFFWLTRSFTNESLTSDPDNMGHNVVALDYSLAVDGTNPTAPGGTYSSALLGCQSCHDPHGQVQNGTANGQLAISVSGSYGAVPPEGTIAGSYRLLGGDQYGSITSAPPIAVTTGFGETDTIHVAYGQGMAEWCASCHPAYLGNPDKHRSGNLDSLGAAVAANYNAYVATGDLTGGAGATAYTALVPFERQETDKAILLTGVTSGQGPDADDNVMCLTCHRAHASAFDNITRWDMQHELLAESWPTEQNLVAMGAVAHADYYGRDIAIDFGGYQRSLCNKCHVRD